MKNYRIIQRLLFIIALIFTATSCFKTVKSVTTVKVKTMSKNSQTLTGQIVKKELVKVNGEKTGHFDLFLRCSIQDYFIKFCESTVTKQEIEALKLGEFDAISVDVEILNGEWDVCHDLGTDVIPTRVGTYIVLHKLYR